VAGNNSIEIVIRARDDFSPAFAELDRALAAAERGGGEAGTALDELSQGLDEFAGSAGAAAQATEEFAQRTTENLVALGESRQEFQSEQDGLSEEAAALHGERLIEIEQETQDGLKETLRAGLQSREESWNASMLRLQGQLSTSQAQMRELDRSSLNARLGLYRTFFGQLAELAATQGRAMAGASKTLAIAAALIDAYRAANAALASVPYPFNFAAAALVLAEGLANVQKIRQVNVAHGGMQDIPEDSTFLLQRGERVLSAGQNRDLTRFLAGEGRPAGAGVTVQNLEIHVLENASAGQALLTMSRADWRHVVTEKVIPALNELAALGIRPAFVEGAV
jgi:hypothetical protein